jgi:hypothetical protein
MPPHQNISTQYNPKSSTTKIFKNYGNVLNTTINSPKTYTLIKLYINTPSIIKSTPTHSPNHHILKNPTYLKEFNGI